MANPQTLAYVFVLNDGKDHTKETHIEDLFFNKQFIDSLQYHSASRCFHDTPNIKRYTRFHLKGTLKLMGCKSSESQKISDRVFRAFEREYMMKQGPPATRSPTVAARRRSGSLTLTRRLSSSNINSSSPPFSSFSSPAHSLPVNSPPVPTNDPLAVTIKRSEFFTIIRHALHLQDYNEPHHLSGFPIACDVQDRIYSFTILLGGTSGCGKSSLAALLASRIGFSSVISTDNIRQIMRKFIAKSEAPILWASTYHAGELLDEDSTLSHKERILKGYEAQNEMIFKQLDALIGTYEQKKESLIIEGVHLDTRLIMRLVKKHPTCIPFLMHISNEAKHRERFAIRSKYMTLDPRQNKYTKFFKNIRIINDYLCSGADEKMIPQIDNTNMDRSLATIHATIFSCLKRHILNGESYYDAKEDNLNMVKEEFVANKHSLWSSKGMLRVIRDKRVKDKSKVKKYESDSEEDYEELGEVDPSGQVGDLHFNSDEELEPKYVSHKTGKGELETIDEYTDEEGDSSEYSDDEKSEYVDWGSLDSV